MATQVEANQGGCIGCQELPATFEQEKLPVYLGFFEFVHNVRKRGKALLPALIELLVT